MNDKEFAKIWKSCIKATDISQVESGNMEKEKLDKLYWVTHCTFKELLQTIGMTPTQFCNHFCIGWQAILAWSNNKTPVRPYVRLWVAREFNLL